MEQVTSEWNKTNLWKKKREVEDVSWRQHIGGSVASDFSVVLLKQGREQDFFFLQDVASSSKVELLEQVLLMRWKKKRLFI